MSLRGEVTARHALGVTRSLVHDPTFIERCGDMRAQIRSFYGHDADLIDEETTRNGVLMRLASRCVLRSEHREAFARVDAEAKVEVEAGRITIRVLKRGAVQTPAERSIASVRRLRRLFLVLALLFYVALVVLYPHKYARWPHCVLGAPRFAGC